MTATAKPSVIEQSEQRPAGIVTRVAAAAIDTAVVAALCGFGYLAAVIARLVWSPTTFSWPELPWWVSLGFALWVAVLYLTAAWVLTGRTFGDSLLGLRVLTGRRRPIGWARAFLRAVFCVFFPVGLAWVVLSPERRSVQDVVLRTTVVYDWRTAA